MTGFYIYFYDCKSLVLCPSFCCSVILSRSFTPISLYFLTTKWMNLTSAGLWRASMKNGERVPGCRLQEGASCSDQRKQAYDRDLLFPLKMKRDHKILAHEKMKMDTDSVSDYRITVNHSSLRATRCVALSYHLVVLLLKIYNAREIQYIQKKLYALISSKSLFWISG